MVRGRSSSDLTWIERAAFTCLALGAAAEAAQHCQFARETRLLTQAQFEELYYQKEPVLLVGAAAWAARQWNRSSFFKRVSALPSYIEDPLMPEAYGHLAPTASVVDYTHFVENMEHKPNYEPLMGNSQSPLMRLLHADLDPNTLPVRRIRRRPYFSLGRSQMGVPFHKHENSWYAQLHGRKLWFLHDGDIKHETKFPGDDKKQARGRAGSRTKTHGFAGGSHDKIDMDPMTLMAGGSHNEDVLNRRKNEPGQPPRHQGGADPCSYHKKQPKGVVNFRRCLASPGDVMYIPITYEHATCNLDNWTLGVGYVGEPTLSMADQAVLDNDEASLRAAFAMNDFGLSTDSTELLKDRRLLLKESNRNAAHIAAFKGSVHMLETLEDLGVDLHYNKRGQGTALHMAAGWGHVTTVEWLVKRRVHPNIRQMESNSTALQYAAAIGHASVVSWLLHQPGKYQNLSRKAAGSNRHLKDDLGQTALHFAAANGHDAIVELFLHGDSGMRRMQDRHGDDYEEELPDWSHPASQAAEMEVAEEYAAKQGHSKVVGMLQQARKRLLREIEEDYEL